MPQAFQLTIDENGIGHLVFDLPNEKVNKFSPAVLEELESVIDKIKDRKDIKALVISSGKEDIFIAGADLHSFQGVFDNPSLAERLIHTGHRVFNKLEKLPFPTIAYINGACLGGGMEMALSCTYRIASDNPKTQLGLPEVTIGLIPGWGGTQRMPRLVGLKEGVNLVLSGKPVKGDKAFKIHLADALAAHEFKDEKTSEFIKQILTPEGRKKILERRKPRGMMHWLIEANPAGRALLFYKAKKDILAKTHGHYPAPLLALEVLKNTSTLPLQQGLEYEANAILKYLPEGAPIAKNLIGLFFIQEALKKDPGVSEKVALLPIKSTAVIGAGVMGSGIAWLLADHDYPVRMKDVDAQALGKGFGAVKTLFNGSVKRKKLKNTEAALKFQKLSGVLDSSGFQHVDFVIEAATENLELKKKIYQDLEKDIPETAIIASNTSSLSITEMADTLKHPERFVGMHFFNPVNRMPLVEIVRGAKTSSQTVATAVDLCKKLGKTPMVVGDCEGFLVNRVFVMGANEVMYLFEEGVDHERLDRMMLNFGFPMPPFVLSDEVGVDVSYKVNQILEKAYGPRMQGPKIIETMYEHKLLGKKTGKGFYLYNGKHHTKFNPEVLKFVKQPSQKTKDMPEMEMQDRAILAMVNEAARCLQEKIIGRPDYLDMALIMGIGFPPFRGGLLKYADSLGINYVVDQLQAFEKAYGSRFAPCELLLSMRQSNQTFYK